MSCRLITIAILGTLLTVSSCKGTGMASLEIAYGRLREVPADKWESLAQKKIFFGHKSVGFNIVEGLQEAMAEFPSIKLNVHETTVPRDFAGPIFAHAPIGTNKDPDSKIRRFREIMEGGIGEAADIALFKFCFIDIDHTTDIEALFRSYVGLVEELESRFPDLKIITVTAPLLSKPVGVMTRLKKLLGRLPYYETDNIKRNHFNNMLRSRFADSLFDLAAVESRIDDSRKATFRKEGRDFEMLRRDFTDDGGHLNSKGRQIVTAELLRTLAEL